IDVLPVNDPPVAADDRVDAYDSSPLTIDPLTLTANDTDVDGDPLSLVAVGNAVNGTVTLNQGLVVFTPSPGFSGLASFQYTVSDGVASASATVQVDIPRVLSLSTTAGGTVTNSDGSTVSFANADILSLDLDGSGSYTYRLFFDGSDVGLSGTSENVD